MNDQGKHSNSEQVRHLWRLSEVPEHTEVLTSLEAEYAGGAPAASAPDIICIANAAREVFLISTPSALHGAVWFHKLALIQKAGYTYAGCMTSEPDVLEMMALGIHIQGKKAKKEQAEDARIKTSLVNESGPLSWFIKNDRHMPRDGGQ